MSRELFFFFFLILGPGTGRETGLVRVIPAIDDDGPIVASSRATTNFEVV